MEDRSNNKLFFRSLNMMRHTAFLIFQKINIKEKIDLVFVFFWKIWKNL